MFQKKKGTRITNLNLNQYLIDTYGQVGEVKLKIINGFKPLLQKDYGGSYDCSLVSITAIGSFKENYTDEIKNIYNRVEKIAKKYFYNSNIGTIPIFIKNILNQAFGIKSKSNYIKNIGFNWDVIKTNINNNNPMILSMANDGRNCYRNHSVVIIGYREYSPTNAKILVVYDNYHRTTSCIDYCKLCSISSINYF